MQMNEGVFQTAVCPGLKGASISVCFYNATWCRGGFKQNKPGHAGQIGFEVLSCYCYEYLPTICQERFSW